MLEVGAEVELQVPEFEVEEPRIYKVERELLDTKDVLEVSAARKELQELRIPESKHEEEFEAEFELPGFVTASCRAQWSNGEYG